MKIVANVESDFYKNVGDEFDIDVGGKVGSGAGVVRLYVVRGGGAKVGR